MFVLQVIAGPYKGQAVQLLMDHPLTIGRSPSCNVRLEDLHLSAAHTEIVWNADGFSVFDLNSANGTLVNGTKTKGRTPIRLGDHVQAGGVIFHLRDVDVQVEGDIELIAVSAGPRMLAFDAGKTEVAMRALIPVDQTQALSALPKRQQQEARGDRTPKDRAPTRTLGDRAMKTTMVASVASARVDADVLSGAAALKQRVEQGGGGATVLVQWEERIDPFWSAPVSIGREHSSGIVLEDAGVSLRHAVIDFRDDRYLLRDVGSSNGVFVNQRRVVEQALEDGDIISVGSHTMFVVLGQCLGLSIQPPSLDEDKSRASLQALGIVDKPLAPKGETPKKKRRKKASELVWYATSDLDRGGFRGRAALVSLMFGIGLTGWMLAAGDSEVLVGERLAEHHEGEKFLEKATANGLDRCTACHVGAGRVSTLKCLDCHPYNRPTKGHAGADIPCVGCHYEHRGSEFAAAADAAYSCDGCHPNPHEKLARTRPKLVAAFDRDAPGDVDFHVIHQGEGIDCLGCHGETDGQPTAVRNSCGTCHAPDHAAAEDCQMCHTGHPDRDPPPHFEAVPPTPPLRFAAKGLIWTVALLVLSFLVAAMIPRRRKVAIEAAEADL